MRLVAGIALIASACKFEPRLAGDGGMTGSDARADATPDTPILDAPIDGGAFCIGSFLQVCTNTMPSTDRNLANSAFDTGDDTNCDQILQGPAGPAVCVVVGHKITITGTFRAFGPRPLAFAAFTDFIINSNVELSVSSTADSTGAGANDASCELVTINGGNGSGGGGGAGGSHHGTGGAGGSAIGAGAGSTSAVAAWSFVRGGCPGGRGGEGTAAAAGGLGGASGGAVMIIGKNKISVAGGAGIAASGEAGRPGDVVGGGGGGGGSGGFIGFDTPMLDIKATARIIANGAGGASGSSATAGSPGEDGKDTPDVATGGSGGGGSGGDGSNDTVLAGGSGGAGGAGIGGGGGGGGAGVILTFDAVPANGIFSPPILSQ
ncbi:MAG TPA: hypothetical protein VFQ53_07180 [Kofleriaceae bacterium]|nr:hypothetical protein [Kofleriaceae bacterium]